MSSTLRDFRGNSVGVAHVMLRSAPFKVLMIRSLSNLVHSSITRQLAVASSSLSSVLDDFKTSSDTSTTSPSYLKCFTRSIARQGVVPPAWQKRTPYSKRSGTPPPSPWPMFEPIKLTPTGQLKWHKTVFRFGDGVKVKLPDDPGHLMEISGQAGQLTIDLHKLDPSGLAAFKMIHLISSDRPPLLALASPDKDRFNSIVQDLDKAVKGVTTGFLVGITVKGVGYRIEPMTEPPKKKAWYFEDDVADRGAIAYPHPVPVPALRLKVGYSRTAIFPVPSSIRAFCIKPNLLYLYGLSQEELNEVAATIRSIRKPSVYTGNGIQLVDEVVRIKPRKASK